MVEKVKFVSVTRVIDDRKGIHYLDAEEGFVEWFNDFYGRFSFRAEHFYGDCEVEDEKTRTDLLYKWIHAAYCAGYERGRTPE